MVQFDNLRHNLSNKLKKFYAERFPKPQEPADYVEPKLDASKVIRADAGARLYVEASNSSSGINRHSNSFSECKMSLMLVNGKDTAEVDIPVEELDNFISELQRMRHGIKEINSARKRELEIQKAYREASEKWDSDRDEYLRRNMSKKGITEKQVEDAVTMKDLWLD